MGRKGKETGADVKIVIMDLMQSRISRRKLSEMLKILKSTVIDICKKFSDTGFFRKQTEKRLALKKIKPRD